jgi:hypothetical protein
MLPKLAFRDEGHPRKLRECPSFLLQTSALRILFA